MAKLTYTMPDDFMKEIEKLSKNLEPVIDKMLEAGGKIAESAVKSNLDAVVGKVPKSRSTGELQGSLGTTPPKTDKKGVRNIRIGFNEPRRKQSSPKMRKGARGRMVAARGYYKATNAMIAGVLEYGKSGQRPRPFMVKAQLSSAKKIKAAMQEELDKAVK